MTINTYIKSLRTSCNIAQKRTTIKDTHKMNSTHQSKSFRKHVPNYHGLLGLQNNAVFLKCINLKNGLMNVYF